MNLDSRLDAGKVLACASPMPPTASILHSRGVFVTLREQHCACLQDVTRFSINVLFLLQDPVPGTTAHRAGPSPVPSDPGSLGSSWLSIALTAQGTAAQVPVESRPVWAGICSMFFS